MFQVHTENGKFTLLQVIYTKKPGEPDVLFGSRLGEFTNELEAFGPGARCTGFVACAPKAYALKITNDAGEDHNIVKIKGFSLNYAASRQLNFEKMCDMMLRFLAGDKDQSVPLNFSSIIRTNNRDVLTKSTLKVFRIVYTKRRILPDGRTLPYGF